MRRAFDPPDFASLEEHPELRKACQLGWRPYIDWWQMPAGGNQALEAVGLMHGRLRTVDRVVRQFEKRHRRRARSFALDIALVYAQTEDFHYDGESFAVLGSAWVFGNRFESWLTERIEAMA